MSRTRVHPEAAPLAAPRDPLSLCPRRPLLVPRPRPPCEDCWPDCPLIQAEVGMPRSRPGTDGVADCCDGGRYPPPLGG